MPLVVGGTVATHVVTTSTHTLCRVNSDHFVAYGRTVPSGDWLATHLPSGDWETEWSGTGDTLFVHITRVPASAGLAGAS